MRKYSLILIISFLLITIALIYAFSGINYDNPREEDIPKLIRNLEIKNFDPEDPGKTYKKSKHLVSMNALIILGDKAIPALIDALEHENWLVRGGAAGALERIGIDSDEVIYALYELMWNEDEQDEVIMAARGALWRLQPGVKIIVPDLIEKLDDPDPIIRQKAVFTLAGVGPVAEPAIGKLIEAINDEDIKVRQIALGVLSRQGPAAKDAVPAIISILENKDSVAAEVAIRALGGIGPAAVDAIPILIGYIDDERSGVRKETAKALGGICSNPESSIPALIVLLDDEYADIRKAAMRALGQFGPSAKDAIPALTKALKDKDHFVARTAAEALGNIGPEPGVVSALTDALGDMDCTARSIAAETLGILAPEAIEAIPVLTRALSDESSAVQRCAAEALGKFGPVAEDAIPELRKTLNDENSLSRIAAAGAIILITPEMDDAILTLMNISGNDKNPSARLKAVTVLGNPGSNANNALPMLRQLLDGEDGHVGIGAALAIAKITQDPTEAVILLIGFLDDDSAGVRKYAANALSEIGPPAAPALDKLEYMAVNDPSLIFCTGQSHVRLAAREAIEKIETTE